MPVLYHVNGNLQRAYCPEQTEIAVTLLGHHTNKILDISDWHGIQNPSSTDKGWNPVRTWDPESVTWNPESKKLMLIKWSSLRLKSVLALKEMTVEFVLLFSYARKPSICSPDMLLVCY